MTRAGIGLSHRVSAYYIGNLAFVHQGVNVMERLITERIPIWLPNCGNRASEESVYVSHNLSLAFIL
jgi:hypothetical protein